MMVSFLLLGRWVAEPKCSDDSFPGSGFIMKLATLLIQITYSPPAI